METMALRFFALLKMTAEAATKHKQQPERGETMETLWTQIGNYGFPMLVTVFLLVRVEKKLDELTVAIVRLGQEIGGKNTLYPSSSK
jgi:hypothetical protein